MAKKTDVEVIDEPKDFTKTLQEQTCGCRLQLSALTTSRAMERGQIQQVADTFNADAKSVGGSRRIINRKLDFVAPVYKILLTARNYVNAHTLDYPEDGMRLIKLASIGKVKKQVYKLRDELRKSLDELSENWPAVREDAKNRLGKAFVESDYAISPLAHFDIKLSFPEIAPDKRLMQLHPDLFAAEKSRIEARFEEALIAAEVAAQQSAQKLLEHFVERLTDDSDGKRKTVKESTINKIHEFVERFRATNIGSNSDLDKLVTDIEGLAKGIDIKALRKAPDGTRAGVVTDAKALLDKVKAVIITRPVRDIDL